MSHAAPRARAPLNPRQRLFVEHYLIDLNGKEAAIRAGYGARDAASRAAKLLRRRAVKAAIGAAMAARVARSPALIAGGVTVARVLEEYAGIAFANIRHFADWGPSGVRFRGAARLTPEDTRLVAELVEGRAPVTGLRRVKLFDKLAALTSLQRILDYSDVARFRLAEAPAAPAPAALKRSARPQFTARERAFAAEYAKDFAGTAAAIRAGYASGGARARATALLRHPYVAAAIEAELEARRRPIRAEADRVLAEYACIAFADIGRIADWSSTRLRLKRKERIARDDTAAIESLGPAQGATLRLRLYDKVYALDALARHLGLLDPRMPGRERSPKYAVQRASAALRRRVGAARLGR